MKKIFTLLLSAGAFLGAYSQSTTVVISQVYGGGGGGGTAKYLFDYIELHNVSAAAQSLTGFSLQYGSATGNFANTASNLYAFPDGTSIPAGGYLLIQCGSTGTAGVELPVIPDLITTSITMSASSGKVVLSNQSAALACGATMPTANPCPSTASFIDVVAYGTASNAEGGTAVANATPLVNTQGAVRKDAGCADTDNNNADFDTLSPTPRNAASAVNICGTTVPIKFEYLKGKKAGNTVALNWKVTCIGTDAVMTIERSATTRDFKEITTIQATQLRCQQPFDYSDAAPLTGKNYYRLKMVDLDGKVSYSPLVVIINGAKGFDFVGLYPTIVKDKGSLSISSVTATSIETRISDISGRIVKTGKYAIPSGGTLIDLDLSSLSSGIYNLTGVAADGTKSSVRFVKY